MRRRVYEFRTQTALAAALAATAALALAACKGPPSTVANRCIEDWPATPVGASAAPLGADPAVLWQVPFSGGVHYGPVVVTDDRVAVTRGARLFVFDRAGNELSAPASGGFERLSEPVVGPDGNFYAVGASAYSYDPDGAIRWIRPLDPVGGKAGDSLVMSPKGQLYTAANDGYLYAIDAADGHTVWRREVGRNVNRPAVLVGGVGNAVAVITRGEVESARAFDADTGDFLSTWATPDGAARFGALIGGSIGVVTQRMEPTWGPYPWMHIASLDRCANERWSIAPNRPQWPVLLLPGDELLVAERDDVVGSPIFVSRYSADGARLAGPTRAATPWVAGADGTIYGLECDTPAFDGPARLIAYTPDLTEIWRLELGAACPTGGPALGADGVLYFTWFTGEYTELVAVQTHSPGLAASSWPMRHRDNRNTGWLVP